MSKGEFSIVGVAAATCLILFFKLQSSEEAMARPSSSAQDEKTAADPCGDTPCVTFLGNIRVGDNFLLAKGDESLLKKDKSYFFESLKPLLDSSAAVIGNLETPLVKRPPSTKADKLNIFWAAENTVTALKEADITAVSLADKHIYDFGDTGLSETVAALEKANIRFFGVKGRLTPDAEASSATSNKTEGDNAAAAPEATGEAETALEIPTIFRQKFSKDNATFELAVFNAMRSPPTKATPKEWEILEFDVDDLCDRIGALKRSFPHIFAVAYIGNAGVQGPASVRQQKEARALVDAGADLVVGYGSRFLQEVEQYKEKWIVYGLGDAVSTADLPIPTRNERWPFSGALRLVLEPKNNELVPSVKLYPILNNVTETHFQPRLLGKKAFGDLFWYLLRKERIEYDFVLKKKMHPGMDSTGRFVSLTRGAE